MLASVIVHPDYLGRGAGQHYSAPCHKASLFTRVVNIDPAWRRMSDVRVLLFE